MNKPNSEAVGSKAQGAKQPRKPPPVPLPEGERAFRKVAKESVVEEHASEKLPWQEWSFHLVEPKQLAECARWELFRHWGMDARPWLALSDEEQVEASETVWNPLEEKPPEVAQLFAHWLRNLRPECEPLPFRAVTFLIDLGADNSELIDAFKNWLDSQPRQARHWVRGRPSFVYEEGTSPKKFAKPLELGRSLLTSLVIYRTKMNAGLTRAVAIKATIDLWKAWELDNASTGILSPPYWSRALKRAKLLKSASCL